MKVCNIIELNKIFKHNRREKNQTVFPHLELSSLELITYTNVSFHNLSEGVNQGAHIIFLTNNGKKCCLLVWNYNKVKRIVRFTLAAEGLTLTL